MRDHTRLKVFELADRLALAVYRESGSFPAAERYGLQSQMRRAAISVAANIVEGCAHTTQTEYLRFIEIAYASARELQYEIELAGRLGFLCAETGQRLSRESTETAKALNGLLRSLKNI